MSSMHSTPREQLDNAAEYAGGRLPPSEITQKLALPADVAEFQAFEVPRELRRNCSRHLDLAVKTYAFFCMGKDAPGQPIYSEGGAEDYSIEPGHDQALDKIIGSHLALLIEDFSVENIRCLQFIREASSWGTQSLDPEDMTRALAFNDPALIKSLDRGLLSGTDIQTRAALLKSFLLVADEVTKAIEEHKAAFVSYGVCGESESVGHYAGLLCDILRNSSFKSDGDKTELSIPHSCRESFPPELHVRDYDTLDPFVAKHKFLVESGFKPHMEHLLALGLLLRYAAQADSCEAGVYTQPFGVQADLITPVDGFQLELEGFTHPKLGLNQPLGDSLIFSLARHNRELLHELVVHEMVWCPDDSQSYLFEKGSSSVSRHDTSRSLTAWNEALVQVGLGDYVSQCPPRWQPGLTSEKLATWGDDLWRGQMLADFNGDAPGSETAFDPIASFRMGGDLKLQTLGADNMEGKTWLLRTLPALILRNQRGRRIPATSAAMTMCDGIYHNIELSSFYGRRKSGLEGDLVAVGDFLKFATPHSAGFFDEIFGKASAPCELSFAWACFEEMERKELVALCSSHNPFLKEFGWTDGLNGLQGHFAPDEERDRGEPRPGFQSLKMQDHNPVPGHVTVSEGFRWADRYLPEDVATRARDIFEYLTGVKPTR